MERRTFLKGSSAIGLGLAMADAPTSLFAASPRLDPATLPQSPPPPIGEHERISLDEGWRFHRGDVTPARPRTHDETYSSTKAGAAAGAAGVQFDDAAWQLVDVPHDFVVEGPFLETENVSQGYRPKGIAWYRKALTLGPADIGKHLELQFDGIATNATIWFNGNVVCHNWSAYNSAYIDVTAFARFDGKPNILSVRVDSDPLQGWWYEGGGIYRHVWLVKRAPVHLITDGVYAHPRKDAAGNWLLPVEATIRNIGDAAAEAQVHAVLLDPAGSPVGEARGAAAVHPLDQAVVTLSIPVSAPRLWSIEEPTLYQVRTSVSVGGKIVDGLTTMCGFRTQRFDPSTGFYLNDKPVKIKGVCIHQDHAGLGVALPDAIIDWRLRRLKAYGCNAIRSSHNAPTRELLQAADRLGILIMDENRLFNSSPDYMAMLEWLVRRDRNHPSVIMWSVFNEEPLQGTREGYEMVRRMSSAVKRLDTTRPVTAAMNNGMFEPVNVSQAVDVVGFNYQIGQYDKFHAAFPDKPMTSSEDTSAVMTRGEYVTDREGRHILAAYDDIAQPWGATHRAAWKAIATRPFVAGAFVWTGFDYRGEPQPFEWPTAASSFGMLDLCGFPKTAGYIHEAQWVTDRPVLHLVPHWNWAGSEGKPVHVMVISNADTVSLSLNGRSLGEQKVDIFEMNHWQVPYAPGRLEAVARSKGRIVARAVVETSGAPAALRLTADRNAIAGDGRDALPITVEALDARGRPVHTANLPVRFAIDGGKIIGLGNGDANSHEPEKGDTRSLYNGLAQVIVQAPKSGPDALVLRAQAAGLKDGAVRLAVRRV